MKIVVTSVLVDDQAKALACSGLLIPDTDLEIMGQIYSSAPASIGPDRVKTHQAIAIDC
ncbi:hypothetical protein [Metapseudomonas boanensis]|uniref:Uncharacterized protein n=1 Tax=Metapseudomonas boanensis TaxID=2822138 RepID=A0ABS5XH41_9GAMM|nr:hypothetical protein [Pseudomonas boanensis]MBT8767004.1 hypothetical protein [Pseudomonas boanensis]